LTDDYVVFVLLAVAPDKFPSVGTVVAAMYEGEFYRGKINEIHLGGKAASILFIDYGNEDTVALEHIRLLPEDLKKAPAIAIMVNLKVPKNDKHALDILNNASDDKMDLKVVSVFGL